MGCNPTGPVAGAAGGSFPPPHFGRGGGTENPPRALARRRRPAAAGSPSFAAKSPPPAAAEWSLPSLSRSAESEQPSRHFVFARASPPLESTADPSHPLPQ